jgi:alpha-D-xyloside xylohydrolase
MAPHLIALAAILLLPQASASLGAPSPNFTSSYPDGSSVTVQLVDAAGSILRIISAPPGTGPTPPSFLIYQLTVPQPPLPPGAGFTLSETAEDFILATNLSIVFVSKSSALATVAAPDGTPLSSELQPVSVEIESQCGEGHGGPIAGGCLRAWRSIYEDEQVWGFGDQFFGVDQAGTTKFIRTCANPSDEGLTHLVSPYFVSSRGYGFALNTHAYTYFDVGYAIPPSPTTPGVHLMHTSDPVFDAFFFLGPTPREVVAQYTQLFGRTAMPPQWSMGQWYHPKESDNQTQVEELVATFASNGVPLAAVTLEPPWQTHSYSCTFVINNETFWDMPGFVANLTGAGTQVTLWLHAYTFNASNGLESPLWGPLYEGGLSSDWITWGGATPDWSLPATKEAVWAYMNATFVQGLGIAAFKLDECDGTPPGTPDDWFFPDNATFPSGFVGHQMHNIYGLLFSFAYHEMFDSMGLRTFLKARANYMGGQRWATTMYSDSYDYGQYTTAVVNSGWGSVTWAPELRDATDPSDFARRAQLMMFSGISSEDAWNNGFMPFPPFVNASSAAIYKTYFDARRTLAPALYSAYALQYQQGLPAVRSLVLDFPGDAATLGKVADQFALAAGLLVAPAPVDLASRFVYFPAGSGTWVDYFDPTGPTYAAGTNVSFPAPDEVLPVFQASGSVIPVADLANADVLVLRATATLPGAGEPAREGPAVLPAAVYADDGTTTRYRTAGEYFLAWAEAGVVQSSEAETGGAWALRTRLAVEVAAWAPAWQTVRWEMALPEGHPLRVTIATATTPIGAATCDGGATVAARLGDKVGVLVLEASLAREVGVVACKVALGA